VELYNMIARWADQEDEENERFPKCYNDKKGNNNNHSDKGQWNNSGNPQKLKPDHEVAAVERSPQSKKLGNNQIQFEKVLHKHSPMHPKSKHSLFECVSLRKSLNAPLPDKDGKRKISKIQRTSSTTTSAATAASPRSMHRS
jgi:hypothetical protein